MPGHLRGPGGVDGLAFHVPCDTNTTPRLKDVQPELLDRLALDGLNKLQNLLLQKNLMRRGRGEIF